MTTQDSTRQLTSRTRLETFSDGVIAIAITLTVLSIGVPRGLPRSRVGSAILDLIPELAIYLLSFAVIGSFWMSHHFALDRIERIDRRIMLLNLAFLACISLVPLVTNLINQYPVSAAVMTYAAVMTLAALSELAIWLHAERHGLIAEEVTQEERVLRRSRLASIAGVFAASIPIALLSPRAGQLVWVLAWVLGFLRVPLVPARRRRRGEPASRRR